MGNDSSKIRGEQYKRKFESQVQYALVEQQRIPSDVFNSDIMLYRDRETNLQVACIEKLNQNDHFSQQELTELEHRLNYPHPNLIKIIGYFSDAETQAMCGNTFQQCYFLENPIGTLRDEIHLRKFFNQPFEELELWSVLYSVVTGLVELRKLNKICRNISASTLYIDHEGNYKISELRLAKDSSLFDEIIMKIYAKDIYLSPGQVAALSSESTLDNTNPFLSDIFSLGVLLIEMMYLDDQSDLFKYQEVDQKKNDTEIIEDDEMEADEEEKGEEEDEEGENEEEEGESEEQKEKEKYLNKPQKGEKFKEVKKLKQRAFFKKNELSKAFLRLIFLMLEPIEKDRITLDELSEELLKNYSNLLVSTRTFSSNDQALIEMPKQSRSNYLKQIERRHEHAAEYMKSEHGIVSATDSIQQNMRRDFANKKKNYQSKLQIGDEDDEKSDKHEEDDDHKHEQERQFEQNNNQNTDRFQGSEHQQESNFSIIVGNQQQNANKKKNANFEQDAYAIDQEVEEEEEDKEDGQIHYQYNQQKGHVPKQKNTSFANSLFVQTPQSQQQQEQLLLSQLQQQQQQQQQQISISSLGNVASFQALQTKMVKEVPFTDTPNHHQQTQQQSENTQLSQAEYQLAQEKLALLGQQYTELMNRARELNNNPNASQNIDEEKNYIMQYLDENQATQNALIRKIEQYSQQSTQQQSQQQQQMKKSQNINLNNNTPNHSTRLNRPFRQTTSTIVSQKLYTDLNTVAASASSAAANSASTVRSSQLPRPTPTSESAAVPSNLSSPKNFTSTAQGALRLMNLAANRNIYAGQSLQAGAAEAEEASRNPKQVESYIEMNSESDSNNNNNVNDQILPQNKNLLVAPQSHFRMVESKQTTTIASQYQQQYLQEQQQQQQPKKVISAFHRPNQLSFNKQSPYLEVDQEQQQQEKEQTKYVQQEEYNQQEQQIQKQLPEQQNLQVIYTMNRYENRLNKNNVRTNRYDKIAALCAIPQSNKINQQPTSPVRIPTSAAAAASAQKYPQTIKLANSASAPQQLFKANLVTKQSIQNILSLGHKQTDGQLRTAGPHDGMEPDIYTRLLTQGVTSPKQKYKVTSELRVIRENEYNSLNQNRDMLTKGSNLKQKFFS